MLQNLTETNGSRLSNLAGAKLYQRLFRTFRKSTRRRVVRYGLLTANLALLLAVSGFVAHGSQAAKNPVKQNSLLAAANTTVANPLDQLSSADIAVHISRITKLPEASSVTEHADTVNAELAITPSDEKVVAKPQVITTGLKSRKDIHDYTTVAGDSVTSLAAKFNITSDTIRWSNNLNSDTLTPGKLLVISPINGIVYVVKAGDTADSLAQKYNANKDQILAFNDAEVNGLPVGEKIVIPDGKLTPTVPTRVTTPVATAGFAWGGYSPVYGSNGYDYGYCTWWAATRRAQTGKPIPSNLGNASSWKVLAQRAGLGVGNTPAAGAVIWFPPRDFYGHVGYVESVNSDGSVVISEMNAGAGWGRVDQRTIPAGEAGNYGYIY